MMTSGMSLAVYLSLNIQISRTEQTQLLAFPLLSLTGLYLWLSGMGTRLMGLVERVAGVGLQLVETVMVSLTVVEIGCKALAWGVR